MADETPGQGHGDEVRPLPELRASHEDRDRVVELLRTAAGDGRLTAEELDERLEVALTARTHSELAVLTADLPATTGAISGPVPQAKDLVRIDTRSGHVKRDGAWVVPQRMQVKVTSGHVDLDFTQAVITHSVLHIDVEVRSGGLTLVTKPGIAVDTDDVVIRSGHVQVREPWAGSAPVTFRITVAGTVGSGRIRVRPRRRTFWQWLRRQPTPYQAAIR